MNSHYSRLRVRLLGCVLFSLAFALATSGRAQPTGPVASGNGRLIGQVSNAATRALLEGAVVELPALGRRALTDNLGRFTFDDLPAGEHTVAATYIGLNREERLVSLAPGALATVTFYLA